MHLPLLPYFFIMRQDFCFLTQRFFLCGQNVFQWIGVLLVFGGIAANMAGKYKKSHSIKIHHSKATMKNIHHNSSNSSTSHDTSKRE